jgi:predicted kinase
MAKKLPRLVIVSGASASGKSSIARDLAAELKLALLAKDDLKEGLFDSLGNPRDEAESQRLGTASYLLIERIGTRILESGVGLVVEGNFWRGRAEPSLGPLVARSRPVIVHCEISPKEMARRIRERLEGKKRRHPGHLDGSPDPELLELLDDPDRLAASRQDVEPPNLEVPIFRLDTSRDHNPPLGKVVKWIKQTTREPDE